MDNLEFADAIDQWEELIGGRLGSLLDAARTGDIRRFNIRRGILYNSIDDLKDEMDRYYYHQADMRTPNVLSALRNISKANTRKREDVVNHNRRSTDLPKETKCKA